MRTEASSKLRVVVRGHAGRMGREACAAIAAQADLDLVGTIGRNDDCAAVLEALRPDVCVDLSTPEALDAFEAALPRTLTACPAYVIGTSGVSRERQERMRGLLGSEHCLWFVPNFCIGSVLLQRFAAEAARFLADVEITEAHHERKVDAPSGTAVATALRIAAARPPGFANQNQDESPSRGERIEGIPVHAVRLPGILARQVVEFGADGEVLTLRHDTISRSAFMPGLLTCVRRIGGLRGLVIGLEVLWGLEVTRSPEITQARDDNGNQHEPADHA